MIAYTLTRAASIQVSIFTPSRRQVRRLSEYTPTRSGLNRVLWDGRDAAGRLVPNGLYLCELSGFADASQIQRAVTVLPLLR